MMVANMQGANDNAAKNQYVIVGKNGIAFQSYKTPIAFKLANVLVINEKAFDYSQTTSKYTSKFIHDVGMDKAKVKRYVKEKRVDDYIRVVDVDTLSTYINKYCKF